MLSAESISKAARSILRPLLAAGALEDAALLGSMSGHYGRHVSNFSDLDVWLLLPVGPGQVDGACRARDALVQGLRSMVDAEVSAAAIDGPYKPPICTLSTDHLFVHLLIDDESTYVHRSSLTRYSWRKYLPLGDPERLFRWSPARPTLRHLLADKWGLRELVAVMDEGQITYPSRDLSTWLRLPLSFSAGSHEFLEFCLYAALTSARNLARVEGHAEPDRLPNDSFAEWFEWQYHESILTRVVSMKKRIGASAYSLIDTCSPICGEVRGWLGSLVASLEERLG